ncbi:MAG: DPP IV N-terminal domain-containing protein, partial [Pseudomonadota bacterium]
FNVPAMWKIALPALALLAACSAAEPQAQTNGDDVSDLTLERIYQSPSLSGSSPRALRYSPDGKLLTFLKSREDDASRLDLWAFIVETGEASMLVDSKILEPEEIELSEQEKALRERQRTAGQRGILRYQWGGDDQILIPIRGDLHLVTLTDEGPQARQLTATPDFEFDAKVSPGGKYVSFIRDNALFAINLETEEETQLSPSADPENAISYGVAEFVAQEEMRRYTGYWWSADSRYVAFTKVDESTVDIVPRFDIAADKVTVIEQRYPKAGRPDAIVDLMVMDMETGDVAEVPWRHADWGPATEQYLTRVNWNRAGDDYRLTVQRVNEEQSILEYPAWHFSPEAAPADMVEAAELLDERHDTWINLSYDFQMDYPLVHTTSESSGYRHIIAWHSEMGGGAEMITRGDWAVAQIEAKIDNTFYFTGYKDTPLEQHLYSITPDDDEPTRITPPGSTWSVSLASDGKSYVGTSSNPNQPPQTGLYKIDGTLITWIEKNALDENHPYFPYLADHTAPEFGTLTAEDGQTLYYSIQTPPDFDPKKTYPAIVEVYGGPHAQTVANSWRRLSDQYLTRQGYIVFRLDNRGMDNRGREFENVIYRRTGGPEVRDQLVGVEWLKSQPFIDADKVAIQGWSYGGYMTLMTLLQAEPGTFAAAVSGAPVTDWALYDTFYTERYMDTPQNNADGYEASSVFPYLDNLEDPLLMIHGMADDNVVFENSTRLYAELQQRGKNFEMMTYPGQRHGIRGEELGIHLMRTRMAFLDRHLKGE